MSFYFVQMADPQFGMFASISELTDVEIQDRRKRGLFMRKAPKKLTGFKDETSLYTKAIEATNRINPAFVVMCGDMVNNADNQDEIDELFRVTSLLNKNIPIHWVSGNHDVGEAPTKASLERYRLRFGPDKFSFDVDTCHFVVLNSSVCFNPVHVPEEWEATVQFLKQDLTNAKRGGCDSIIIFTHHPLFEEHADEDDGYFVIPRDRRRVLLEILHDYDASAVFAGHMHRNNYAVDGNLQMVVTGAVGYPLGEDPSGLRIVKIYGNQLTHQYYPMDDIPYIIEL